METCRREFSEATLLFLCVPHWRHVIEKIGSDIRVFSYHTCDAALKQCDAGLLACDTALAAWDMALRACDMALLACGVALVACNGINSANPRWGERVGKHWGLNLR